MQTSSMTAQTGIVDVAVIGGGQAGLAVGYHLRRSGLSFIILDAEDGFSRFFDGGVEWADGTRSAVDAVIWCTGFRPALDHVAGLGIVEENGTVALEGTRSVREPRLWFVGYGGWTGPASATLIGVGRSARDTARRLIDGLATALEH